MISIRTHHLPSLWPHPWSSGGDVRIDGETGEGRVDPRADAALPPHPRLHQVLFMRTVRWIIAASFQSSNHLKENLCALLWKSKEPWTEVEVLRIYDWGNYWYLILQINIVIIICSWDNTSTTTWASASIIAQSRTQTQSERWSSNESWFCDEKKVNNEHGLIQWHWKERLALPLPYTTFCLGHADAVEQASQRRAVRGARQARQRAERSPPPRGWGATIGGPSQVPRGWALPFYCSERLKLALIS